MTERLPCVCGCRHRTGIRHHVVYVQHLRSYATPVRPLAGLKRDPRNLVPFHYDCHLAHHNGSRRLPLWRLPDSVFEFATELMGPAAFDYLARRYDGGDPRLDALLS